MSTLRATKLTFMFLWQRVRLLVQRILYRTGPLARQPYLIGELKGTDPEAVFRILIDSGFQPNYFSLADEGELYNLRSLSFREYGQLWQEHVRIFPDEVRAHAEIAYDLGLGDAVEHMKGTTVRPVHRYTLMTIQEAIEHPVLVDYFKAMQVRLAEAARELEKQCEAYFSEAEADANT
jgi:hypothetical protein